MASPDAEYRRLTQNFAREIRKYRRDHVLTQEKAAELLQIAPRHLQKIEAGEVNVTLRTVAKVCSAFKLSASRVLSNNRADQPKKL